MRIKARFNSDVEIAHKKRAARTRWSKPGIRQDGMEGTPGNGRLKFTAFVPVKAFRRAYLIKIRTKTSQFKGKLQVFFSV